MIYLDNNATTEPLPQVKEAVLEALSLGASNPSSAHLGGEPARRLLSQARDAVACLIGASPEEVFFTSGGTEANNWTLEVVSSKRQAKLLISPVEHESVLRKAEMLKARGVAVEELPVDSNGVVRLDVAEERIASGADVLSVQWVNNETGVIQPVESLAEICRQQGTFFHTDAAQAVGKLPVDVKELRPDYLTFTGHKIHAPMGVGVLFRRQGAPLVPLMGGGQQESGLRPGSENLAGIAGLAMAARVRSTRLSQIKEKLAHLRDTFEKAVVESCQGALINGGSAQRVCNTTNIRFPGVAGDALVAQLSNAGVCCSQGSACTSQIPEPSHVLLAMGLTPQQAYESVRFSFSELNTYEEIEPAVNAIRAAYVRLVDFLPALMDSREAE